MLMLKKKTPKYITMHTLLYKNTLLFFAPDRYFVPLLRATDNTLNPVIGAPWAPGTSKHQDVSLSPGLMEDPKNPLMTIRAFVGPLNLLKVSPASHSQFAPQPSLSRGVYGCLTNLFCSGRRFLQAVENPASWPGKILSSHFKIRSWSRSGASGKVGVKFLKRTTKKRKLLFEEIPVLKHMSV